MAILKNIIVRQVIGRTLLDASKSNYTFELIKTLEDWHLTIYGVEPSRAEEVMKLIADSNVFYTEYEDQLLVRKWWLYHRREPLIHYDTHTLELTIRLDSMVSYTNE